LEPTPTIPTRQPFLPDPDDLVGVPGGQLLIEAEDVGLVNMILMIRSEGLLLRSKNRVSSVIYVPAGHQGLSIRSMDSNSLPISRRIVTLNPSLEPQLQHSIGDSPGRYFYNDHRAARY
jgi:hypothetical protein